MSALLAAGAVLLVFAAMRELAGALEGRTSAATGRLLGRLTSGRAGSIEDAAQRLRLPERLRLAGLDDRIDPATVIAAKLAGVAVGGVTGVLVAPVVPARLGAVVIALLVAAGFLAPEALIDRIARRRRERFVGALPDALDMLAVGAASGRSPVTVFGEIAAGTSGPLAGELAATVAEIECGRPVRAAIEQLRDRVAGAEVGALAAAIERSASYGSPLAEQLHAQATALRRDARRGVEERAARAAPKIQLVVALVLVPSVLLMILAAVVAHSDTLLAGL